MHSLVLVLMVLVCFNFILKQTWQKKWSVAAHALAAALFTGFMWPFAIEQSRSQIDEWLSNPALMLDTSVIITVEVILQMAFCLLCVHLTGSGKLSRSTIWLYRVLRWFPGVLILPVLFSLLVFMVFSFPGVPFKALSWGCAAAVLVSVPLGVWAIERLFPEKELRLELFFLTNILTAIVAIIATVNGRTAVATVGGTDLAAMAGVLAMVAAGFIIGWKLRLNLPFRSLMKKLKNK